MNEGLKPGDKWPYQYFGEIIKLKTRAERNAALDKVPEIENGVHIREWVKFYVEDCFEKRK